MVVTALDNLYKIPKRFAWSVCGVTTLLILDGDGFLLVCMKSL